MDSLSRLLQRAGAPPLLSSPVLETLAERPPIPPQLVLPRPSFTRAWTDGRGRQMPQAIAHRGFKAKYPENTLLAFQKAIQAGAHAIETDVHLTKDGVVVLSHDASLKRCFGVDKKLIHCTIDQVKQYRTLREPAEPCPTLEELCRLLARPENAHVWLLLDIKMDNPPDDIMRHMSTVFQSVPSSVDVAESRWQDRVLLGCWAAKFIPLCPKYFPDYCVANIGFSTPYARQFLHLPDVSFNMIFATCVSPWGQRFIRDAKESGRQVYAWTVNDPRYMDWCIRTSLDGICTDDPEQFLQVCADFDENNRTRWSFSMIMDLLRINVFVLFFAAIFQRKFGFDRLPRSNQQPPDARHKLA